MEKRYIDLIHELQDCETARNFVLARAEAAEADARECRAERARYGDMMTARLVTVEAERDALRDEIGLLHAAIESDAENRLAAHDAANQYRAFAADLREELAALRAIAQNALDQGGDMELVCAPLYQQALEDIASEPQDE